MSNLKNKKFDVPHADLMDAAKASLSGKWGIAVGVTIVYLILTSVVDEISYLSYASFLVTAPLALGLAIFSLNIARDKSVEFADMFEGFNNFIQAVGVGLLSSILTWGSWLVFLIPVTFFGLLSLGIQEGFLGLIQNFSVMSIFKHLWFSHTDSWLLMIVLLLIIAIPSIVIGLGLSQAYYLLVDEPDIPIVDALKKSWSIMEGQKRDLFMLQLTFLPLAILSIFTLFIALLWIIPYMQVTFAKYHDGLMAAKYPSEDDEEYDIEKHLVP